MGKEKDNLSRREFLKMVTALAASGVFAWGFDKPKVEAKEVAPAIGDEMDIGVYQPDGGEAVPVRLPFYPYYTDRSATLITWGPDGEEIITRYGD